LIHFYKSNIRMSVLLEFIMFSHETVDLVDLPLPSRLSRMTEHKSGTRI